MNVTMNRNDNELIVELEGRLDTVAAPELEGQIEPALEGVEKLIIDLESLEYISSAGLRVMLTTMQTMEEQGEMIVRNVGPDVMEVFKLTGFAGILNIE